MTESRKFQIGDSVRVKTGTKDPDFGIDISGWQGRISETDDDLICIIWDSITCSSFPEKHIFQCEEDGLDWQRIYLEANEVEPAGPRDTAKNVIEKSEEIQSIHRWDDLGASGKRIQKILKNVDPADDLEALNVWETYLTDSLSFPFEAEISECLDDGPLQQGDKIRIHGIMRSDDWYGIIIKLRLGRKVYHTPLCEIEVLDKKSNNYTLVDDYINWFGGR